MHSRDLLLIAACLAFGLAGCVPPLRRDHGYPAEWPRPAAKHALARFERIGD